jgi:2-dehydro-3-deoxyphosphogluconate aldolase/(4S)-4-hydroxy-2-oxoglutarate aldolase
MLKAIAGPFPKVTFCPTGGISPANYRDYLALANVACVGGSWIVPGDAVVQEDWKSITALAREAVSNTGL